MTGGTKKTNFKGGGGDDSLVGGSGKDVFFYAKTDKGDATIADFDFSKDKLKIASGTINAISSISGGVQFEMKNGSFKIDSFATYTSGEKADYTFKPTETLIKANSTYYWFAQEGGTDINGDTFVKGALITHDTKVKKSDIGSDYAVIDLGYSTNLVKTGVAVKVASTGDNSVELPKSTTES